MRKSFTLSLLSLLLSLAPVQAVLITLGGTDYNVSTITGTFKDNEVLLKAQPWWGSAIVAGDAATQVLGALGTPNSHAIGDLGPIFARGQASPFVVSAAYNGTTTFVITPNFFETDVWTYAVATPAGVPDGGSTALLLLLPALALGASRRRHKMA